MEDGQGLIVIAILVITFINWLSQTLKQKAAKKDGELVDKSNERATAAKKNLSTFTIRRLPENLPHKGQARRWASVNS